MKEYKGYRNDINGRVDQAVRVDKDCITRQFVRVDFIMKDRQPSKFVKATKKVNYV